MNREESIAFVNELCSEYRAVKGLQKEIDDNEALLRNLNDTKFVPNRLFPFFRRYLITGVITLVVMLIPALIFSGVIFFISFESNLKPVYPITAIAILFFINLAVPAVIIIRGFRKAKRRRDELNRQDVEKAGYNKKRIDDLMLRTEELRKQKEAKLESLQKNDLIPGGLMKSEKIEQLRRLLVTGKAQTLSDAVEMMKS